MRIINALTSFFVEVFEAEVLGQTQSTFVKIAILQIFEILYVSCHGFKHCLKEESERLHRTLYALIDRILILIQFSSLICQCQVIQTILLCQYFREALCSILITHPSSRNGVESLVLLKWIIRYPTIVSAKALSILTFEYIPSKASTCCISLLIFEVIAGLLLDLVHKASQSFFKVEEHLILKV